MNREQKSAAIAEIAAQIEESQAIFAVDYRGISVPQVAELRGRLREADASFKVVKNSLTERAADASGAETLKELLIGPTALTFVRGDAATAAKAIADYGRTTQLLPFKGGLMDGSPLDVEQIRSLSRLYGQLVGVVSSPVTGLVRTLGALLGGLASALGQVRTKMESGEIPSAAPAEAEPAAELAASEEPAPEAPAEAEPAAEAEAAQAPAAEEPAAQTETPEQPAAEAEAATQGEQTTQGDPETEAKPASESEAPADAAEDAPPEAAAQDAGPEGAGEADAGEDDEQGADRPTGEQSADDTSNQED